MRRTRLLRWLTIGAVALVGALVALDVVVLNYTESRAASELAKGLAGEDATVDLGGFPFVPSFVSGRMGRASGRVKGANAPGGLRVGSISVTATDLSFSPRRAFALVRSRFAARTELRCAEAIVEIQLNEQDIEDHLQAKLGLAPEVRVTSAGVEVSFDTGDATPSPSPRDDDTPRASARFLPRVEEGVFSLRLVSLARVPTRFREQALRTSELISLPKMPDGLRADIRLGDGVIVALAQGRDIAILIGEAGA